MSSRRHGKDRSSKDGSSKDGSSRVDSTANFTSEYRVSSTAQQDKQYKQDQATWAAEQSLIDGANKVDDRFATWEKAYANREKVYDETKVARRERRGRDDPDIKRRTSRIARQSRGVFQRIPIKY
jgi:hypothetical protein